MHLSEKTNSVPARIILASFWGMVCSLTILAPVFRSHSWNTMASFLYLLFAGLCHQIPARSFMFAGYALAVCHRCFGIYIGLFLGSLFENRFIHRSPRTRRLWILATTGPLALDFLFAFSGIRPGTGLSRFATGLLFGYFISSLLVRGIAELLHEAPWRPGMAEGN